MSRNNKDFKDWQESLLGFLVSLGILFFLTNSYNDAVFSKGLTTNSKVVRKIFEYLDVHFGKEYVFGLMILITILFGIAALKGYLKEGKPKHKD